MTSGAMYSCAYFAGTCYLIPGHVLSYPRARAILSQAMCYLTCYLILGLVKWESSCSGINYGWLVAMQNVGMCYGLEEATSRQRQG